MHKSNTRVIYKQMVLSASGRLSSVATGLKKLTDIKLLNISILSLVRSLKSNSKNYSYVQKLPKDIFQIFSKE